MRDDAMAAQVLGLDARCLRSQRTGVERMFFNFVASLPASQPPYRRVILFTDGPLADEICAHPLFETVIVPPVARFLRKMFDSWMAFQLPNALKKHGVSVFYSPNTKFPFCKIPSFVTVHGLEWHFQGTDYPLVERIKQRLWFALCTRFSAGIVTFAEHTRRDIQRLRPRLTRPVSVVGEAAASVFKRVDHVDRMVPRRMGIETPYILSVCSLEPRKNIDALLRAFASVADDAGQRHTLVLVGRAAWRSSRLSVLVKELKLEGRVRFAGYVSDDDLVQLYNQAACFIYPSKYEGFGLPILEAMACGTPVASSHASALREVASDAAVLFDPASVPEMTEALRRLIGDATLRHDLVQRGLRRAAMFDWGKTTRDITRFISACPVSP